MTASLTQGPLATGTIRTTAAAATTLLQWTVPLDSAGIFLLTVNGTATSGDTLSAVHKVGLAYRGGATTVSDLAAPMRCESGSNTWVVAAALSAGQIVVTVTGEAGHDIVWTGVLRAAVLSSLPQMSTAFDGGASSEYVDLGATLGFDVGDPFSVAFWIKPTAAAAYGVISKRDVGVGWAVYRTSTSRVELYMKDAVNLRIDAGSTETLATAGAWHFCAITWDGNASPGAAGARAYIDAIACATTVWFDESPGTIVNAATAAIGRSTFNLPGFENWLDGSLASVAVYDRELTPAEALQLYNGGKLYDHTGPGAPTGLVLWQRMGSGDEFPTLTDRSASGFNGTMTNMEAGDLVADVP